MAIQIQGNSGVISEVESTSRASRVTTRPIDVGALGAYALNSTTGTMVAGLAAGSPVYSFRWSDSSGKVALIRTIRLSMSSVTAMVVGLGFFDVVAARSWTASDSGGNLISLAGNNNKRRTSFGSSLAEIRQSSTAALTAGTRTLDGNAIAGIRFGTTAVANTVFLQTNPVWTPDFDGEWPLVLGQNEGFVIRATVPGTGTWNMDVSLEWSEVASF